MANGKRGAQHNATTHGIFAGIFLSGAGLAEAEEFHKLLSAAREAIRPANGLEEILTEKLAMLFLRLGRLYRADLKISAKLFARVTDSLNTTSAFDESIQEQIVRTQRDPTVDSIIRYEASLERQIHRTICQVQELRRMREIEIVAISEDAKSSESRSSTLLQDPEPHP